MGTKETTFQRAEVVDYVSEMSRELRQMADAADRPFLAYLLSMAHHVAAEEQGRSSATQPATDEA